MKLGLGLGWVSPDTDWASEPEIQGSVLSPSNAAFCRQLGITHIIGSGESRTPTGSVAPGPGLSLPLGRVPFGHVATPAYLPHLPTYLRYLHTYQPTYT